MYSLKSTLKRGMTLSAAFALVVAAVAPVTPAFADTLNPLTERSLTLSSSSPGWANTDGSGNSTYAPPNSGANGEKTGNYFDFKVSSDSTANTIKAMTFQYCTTSAGDCLAPGNNGFTGSAPSATRNADDFANQKSDLNIVYPTASGEVATGDFATVVDSTTGLVKAVPGYTNSNPKYIAGGGTGDAQEAAKAVTGHYVVMSKTGAGPWIQNSGWTVAAANQETGTVANATATGNNNTIVLSNGTGLGITPGSEVKVLFFANATDYIQNPGAGAFFVKINTYSAYTNFTTNTILDGGVTVANVMNESIQITTKVLETMQFSVGTVDPNTLTSAELNLTALNKATHGTCDIIQKALTPADPQNVLQLGNQAAESSLETDKAYATHSYWRLSSNSSAGATVYYSGHTLANTSGDEIAPIGVTAKPSGVGSEQFGLAIASLGGPSVNTVNYSQDRATDANWENAADNGKLALDASTLSDNAANLSWHAPRLFPLVPTTNYGNGSGRINGNSSLDLNGVAFGGGGYDSTNAQFAFDPLSDTIPTPIASEDTQVVDCVTAKMRYIGNIAATTPAGIYTTKINYIAAPQY